MGTEEALRNAVQIALEGRFGALDAELVALIAQADPDRLRDALAHIAVDTLEQLRVRLGA